MQAGITVYLEGPPKLLARRVMKQDGAASRPLLTGDDGRPATLNEATDKLQALLRERDSSYRNADCVISVGGEGELGASAPEVCQIHPLHAPFPPPQRDTPGLEIHRPALQPVTPPCSVQVSRHYGGVQLRTPGEHCVVCFACGPCSCGNPQVKRSCQWVATAEIACIVQAIRP